jgi:hypothetical protein
MVSVGLSEAMAVAAEMRDSHLVVIILINTEYILLPEIPTHRGVRATDCG